MVVPTVYPALHDPEVYPEPDTFTPERWITGDAESKSKNWLVFGTGPHYCLGQHVRILYFYLQATILTRVAVCYCKSYGHVG